MVGDDFMKFYVCLYNKWNPYSKEVQEIPFVYWVVAFNFIQVKLSQDWKSFMLPHAEMIGQLTHPEIYKEYAREKKKYERLEKNPSGKDYFESTSVGIEGGGISNAKYDPQRGLVDEEGRVIIPKEKYDDMLGLDGVAISM